jgi:Rod binding domain-containing protein
MSAIPSFDPSLLSGGLPPVNQATEPAVIRNGGPAAKKAYQEALGFESILVNQLSQELASTVSSPGSSDGSSSDSSDSSSSSGGGLLGGDPSTSAFSNMIPQALSTSIMSAGGLGIATRLAESLDPAILTAKPSTHGAGK